MSTTVVFQKQASLVCDFSTKQGASTQFVQVYKTRPDKSAQGIADFVNSLTSRGLFIRTFNPDILSARLCCGCQECLQLRVNTERFLPRKTDRQALRKNSDVLGQIFAGHVAPHLYEMFKAYFEARHPSDDIISEGDLRFFTKTNDYMLLLKMPDETRMAAGLFDVGPNFIKLNHVFYDPNFLNRSPGRLVMLKMIELARKTERPYLLIGEWHKNYKKMFYKAEIPGVEVYTSEGWKPFNPQNPPEGLSLEQVVRHAGYEVVSA